MVERTREESMLALDERFLSPPRLPAVGDGPLDAKNLEDDTFDLSRRMGPIYDILRHPKTETPLAVAIYGKWGAGKTSAMRWLEGRLDRWNDHVPTLPKKQRESAVTVHSTWFYPWKYQEREDVWRGLVAEVILACLRSETDGEKLLQEAKALGGFLGRSFLRVIDGLKVSVSAKPVKAEFDLKKALDGVRGEISDYLQPESDYLNEFERALESWLTDYFGKQKRLVVFIDDLDRCMPMIALQVLEALKLYLNIENLIFVMGVDQGVVNRLVTKHYEELGLEEEISGNYLAKMFQVEATVAPSDRQIGVFLDSILSKNPAWGDFEPSEREIFRTVIRGLSVGSPREVKRLVNSALMVGAGMRMSAFARGPDAEPITPAQGTQVFLVRKILEKYRLDSVIGREVGTEYFTDWSKIVCENNDTPQSIPVSYDVIAQIKQHHEDQMRPELGAADQSMAEDAWAVLLNPYAPPYHSILKNRSFADANLLDLLKDESLGALMQLPYPKEATKIGGIDADTTSAGLIREAIARALSIEIGQVAPTDHGRVTELDLGSAEEVTNLEPLKDLKNLESLTLNDTKVADLKPLKELKNLQWLYLNSTQVADLKPLENLKNLLWLDLDFTLVADLKPLKGLESLQGLGLNGAKNITNLKPLEGLKNLESLDLDGTGVVNLEPLKGLVSLQSLYLDQTKVADLEPLRDLRNLQRLDLDGTKVIDLEPLKGLTNLERLDLNGTNGITDLKPLEGLKSLQWLDLDGTNVIDLEPLNDLTNLERLDLDRTRMITNFRPLKNLESLQRLDLDGTRVIDLEPLKGLTNLERLFLNDTQVTDLKPLEDLKSLKWLDLNRTEVIDLEPLRGLTNLERLDFSGAEGITNLEPLEDLKNLQKLYLRLSHVSDDLVTSLQNKLPNLQITR